MKLLTFEEFRKVNSKDHRVGYGLAQAYGDYCAREALQEAFRVTKSFVENGRPGYCAIAIESLLEELK